jgi:predicted pyridoxine 5'-phosphate oxidase superfamily flavin-nucleotide-binding protein
VNRPRATDESGGQPGWPEEDHVCTVCQLSYSRLPVADAIVMIQELPAWAEEALARVPPAAHTWRPHPSTWSVTEYLCHLRDVYATYTVRLHRARTEEQPALEPMFNDLRARRLRYNERDAHSVLDELAATVAGFCDEAAVMQAEDWARTVSRLPGETRTARWLLRQAAHEGRHHLRDIATMGALATRDTSASRLRPGAATTRATLAEEDVALIERVRLAHVASVTPAGAPHVSPKGTLWPVDQHTVAFAHIHSHRTVKNIGSRPQVAISVVDVFRRRGLILTGLAEIIGPSDERFNDLIRTYDERRGTVPPRTRAVVAVEITGCETVWSPAYDSGTSEALVERTWRRFYCSPTTTAPSSPHGGLLLPDDGGG